MQGLNGLLQIKKTGASLLLAGVVEPTRDGLQALRLYGFGSRSEAATAMNSLKSIFPQVFVFHGQ